MPTYRSLFSLPEFRTLFVVRVLTMLGVVVSGLALGTVMYDATSSPLLAALAMFGGPLVQLVAGRYLLASSDLLSPRKALIIMGTTSAVVDLLQLIPDLPWAARFAVLASQYVVMSATGGTTVALLTDIVPAESFVLGRATLNLTVGGMQVLGNGLAATLLLLMTPVHLFALSAVASVLAVTLARFGLPAHPPRARGSVVQRTREINAQLLGSPILRPVFVMMWVPNGLIVGCEALFVPYARGDAGYLFAASAAGMLLGDVVVGRFVPEAVRQRSILALRALLAAPYLLMLLSPSIAVTAALTGIAAFGYTAALPLQERVARLAATDVRGQAFALFGLGMMAGQAVGALIGGTVGGWWGPGPTMAALGALSLATSLALSGPLHRSAP